MSVLSRLADARNTAEGKALSVIMASLLVVSTFNVTAWASDAAQETSQDVVTEVSDKKAPEQEPAQTPEPEKKPEAKAPEAQPAPEAEKPAVEAQPEAEAPVAETSGDKTTASLENPAPRPEAEQPAKAPAAPAEDEAPSTATLKLQVTGAEITYDGKPVAANAQELTVPSGEDAKFTVAAEEGFQLSGQSVQLLSPAGVKCTLAPNAAGEYVIAAEKAETGATIVVTADPVAQEPEAPAEEPATPEVVDEPQDPYADQPSASVESTQTAYFYLQYPGAVIEEGKHVPGNWLYAGEGTASLPAVSKGAKLEGDVASRVKKAPTYFNNKTITIDNVRYSYDPEGTKENSFHIVWDKALVSNGANNSHRWDGENGTDVSLTTEPSWHIDGHLVINVPGGTGFV